MKTAPLAAMLTILLLALAVAIPAMNFQDSKPMMAEAVRLTDRNWDQYVPAGKEVDAISGDVVLRNKHLTAVIAQAKDGRNANMTVKDVGGALIDLTTRNTPSDQLSAFYPGKRTFKYSEASVSGVDPSGGMFQMEMPQDGAGLARGRSVSIEMKAPATESKPQVTTSYRLAADQPYLLVITEFTNTGTSPLTFELEDDLRLDGGKEDLIRAPNDEANEFWAYDRHWNQAYGLTIVPDEHLSGRIQMNSDARTSTLKYLTPDGKTSATLPPGDSLTITRRLFAAADLLQVRAWQAESNGYALASARITFVSAGEPIGRALVELIKEDGLLYGSARTTEQGTLETSLPKGTYGVRISALGNRLDKDGYRIEIADGVNQLDFDIAGYQTGRVEAEITDAAGDPVPCKVEFKPRTAELKLDFGPETAEFGVRNLRYTPNGKFTQELPVGEYDMLISHGPEFDLVEQKLTVTAKQTTKLSAKLHRTVDTAGWVSSDFHSHASPSGDNTSSQLGRVLNLVAEHVEFAPCTEHNRIDTYTPHIQSLGIKNFLATVSGIELTGQPLPLNHQNAFPMKMTPHTQDNGAPQPADNLEDQIERLALWDDRAERLVQVNHPDLGWMFYDKNGDGQPDGGFERAVPYMDVIEIHPVDSALHLGPVREFSDGKKYHNTIYRWLQLLNQGYRIYGVVNTDAHYNFHGSGGLRNWIQSSTDDPAKIDTLEMVHAAEQGRLVMSNGPFLEVWANEAGQAAKVTCGQDLTAKSKAVQLKVRVQCPNWLDVDRVFVLINGRVSPQHDFTRDKSPNLFRSGVVKFDQTLEFTLEKDAHLIVVAGDVGGSLGKVMGPGAVKIEPAALTNPIYVDVDGNGFQPSKDTLDHPLPVKFAPGP